MQFIDSHAVTNHGVTLSSRTSTPRAVRRSCQLSDCAVNEQNSKRRSMQVSYWEHADVSARIFNEKQTFKGTRRKPPSHQNFTIMVCPPIYSSGIVSSFFLREN